MEESKSLEEDEVRIQHSLNKKEQEFVAKRREAVFQSLQKLKIHCNQNEVPNIALLSSGGGQRAMVGLLETLVQLKKAGLLDCILYLSGVSGSTWCMASLDQEPDWSTKLETVKDKIIKRLSGPRVSLTDALNKLKKYYYEKDIFSLTDVWAAMAITEYVKEIDEHTLTDQQDQHDKDPLLIYTVIDVQCKQCRDGDPWFEISPYESGYSLTGAFVKTSSFGSQFDKGRKIKNQPEMDMLYLQALCGSSFADGEENEIFIWKQIRDFFNLSLKTNTGMFEEIEKDSKAEKCFQVLMYLTDMNLSVLNGVDPFALDQSIRTNLNELTGDKHQLDFQVQKLDLADKEAAKLYMKKYTIDVCNYLNSWFSVWPFDVCLSICRCAALWIWGRKYDFLHNMTDKTMPAALLESETRDYIDAGLLLNSPYFSVLRKERNIDLIISLDFSEGDSFVTVKETAHMCKKQNIPFPEVNLPNQDVTKRKDFYVFKGRNAPTVIHIPLFNVCNCQDEVQTWRNKYSTCQSSYSAEMITDLMKVAGENISNNKEKLKEQIQAVIEKKRSRR
ncbi:cytosolic phospholipase A2 gamma-like [Garra rufa]|uniref:cytosolic phospholipase A2 gamma-like n=1 Tax=Garra rufa TaxID=137080 RepID=UPI003CCEA8EB